MGWEFLARSLVHPWFILGLLHGRDKDGTREGNPKKSAFAYTHILGGHAYPVRHYPVAIRLRDRNSTPHQFTKLVGDPVGSRHSMYCLNPQSGDFSDAILEVPFKALLHLIKVLFIKKTSIG